MDKEQQKVDVRVSDILVSIAPAAVRTLIGVTSSLGTLQVSQEVICHRFNDDSFQNAVQDQLEKVNSKSLFNPKPFKDAHFWFTQSNRYSIDCRSP
jgi:hypothetical protein